jgi:tetratricopeptide (TPR) repeat protein
VGAIPWCEKAVAASPSWIEPRLLLARVYLKLERPAAAGSVYEDIDRLAPWSPWGPYGVGWVAWMRGDRERAAARFDEALKRDPDHLPSLRVRAAVAQAAGDAAAEARCLSRALVLMPEDPALHLRLADLAQAQERQEDVRRHLERAWSLDPRPATAHRLADLARLRGDPEDLARWTARAGDRRPVEGATLTNDEVR